MLCKKKNIQENKNFYAGMKDTEPSTIARCTSLDPIIETNSLEQFTMKIKDNGEQAYQNSDTTCEGSENLDLMLSVE